MAGYSFNIPAAPIPQPRQRIAMRGKFPVAYVPSKHPANDLKAVIRQVAESSIESMMDGAVFMSILFVFPRPKTKMWKRRPMPRYPHTGKRDLDNLAKTVMDALTGIAYRDDGQIFKLKCEKLVAAGDEKPHIEIRIESDDARDD